MAKIFLAGHNGMVGSALYRSLQHKDNEIIVTTRNECDLIDQKQVNSFFTDNKFDIVYLAAAKVGGIYANNTYPAQFIYENLMIQNNVIHSAYRSGIEKLMLLGSSCIYPKMAKQPISEDSLLSGKLEPTNEPYAIAKIAGIKMCESYNRQYGTDYRCIMPTNLYGPGDNYHSTNSHVVPALIRRFHEAKINNISFVEIWGSGKVYRDFLYVDDMARASIFLMNIPFKKFKSFIKPMMSHINAGSGNEISIKDLANEVANVVGFKGDIVFDESKPDGTPRKLLDNSLINKLGWKPRISLKEGLIETYKEFKEIYNG